MFDPDFLPPLLSPDNTYHVESLCTCSVLCVLLEKFFFFCLGRVHVISTGSISTFQTEVVGSASS
ncbi:unnamed protein product [Staurois parvus]|uniref:Uncharacterized protein n=1 Tax=Staurois parvus TaxID=386267 RepID=A0ABN9DT37_9NEOB|nr:unnamed protein product [Staurois parvus]